MSPIAWDQAHSSAVGELEKLLGYTASTLKQAQIQVGELPRLARQAAVNPNGQAYTCAAPNLEQCIAERLHEVQKNSQAVTEPAFTAEQVNALRREDQELIEGLRREVRFTGESWKLEAEGLHGQIIKAKAYAEQLEQRLEELRKDPPTEAALDTLIDILNRPVGGIGILSEHGSVRDFVRRALSEWRGSLR